MSFIASGNPAPVDPVDIARGLIPGQRIVNRYGRNFDVDGAEDIWPGGGDYSGFPAAADVVEILSTSANDAAAGTGARSVRFYYLDANGNAFDSWGNWLYSDVTLNGVTPVSTGITALRVWSVQVITAGSGKTNAGTLTMRQVSAPAVAFCSLPAGYSRCLSSVFTVPLGWSGWILDYDASMQDTTANQAVLCIKTITNGVQSLIRPFAISTQFLSDHNEPPGGVFVPELTDVVFRALSVQNANADISASYSMQITKN